MNEKVELVLIRLAPTDEAPHKTIDPETIKDILSGDADSTDRPEHVKVGTGPDAHAVDVVIFLLPGSVPADVMGLRICWSAIERTPVLSGWTAALLSSQAGSPSYRDPAN